MKTTLENIGGIDVLRVDGQYTWDEACNLPEKLKDEHGITDWVLPDRTTLAALAILVDRDTDGQHWSSSPDVGCVNYAWCVSFHGGIYYINRNNNRHVRLVRASQCLKICAEAAKRSMTEVGITPEAQPVVQEPVACLTEVDDQWAGAVSPVSHVETVSDLALKAGMKWCGLRGVWLATHYQLDAFAVAIKRGAACKK